MAIDYRRTGAVGRKEKPVRRPWGATWRARVSGKDRLFFIQRLALLLETAGSLHPSLLALQAQTKNPALAKVIGEMADEVMGGKAFSEALANHPRIFSPTYVSLVGAAERGGYLPRILNQLLVMEEKQAKMQAMLVSALSYPAFLMLFSLGVIIFILVAVFPKFADMFAAIRDHLPVTTLLLMSLSDLIQGYWFVIIVSLGALLFGLFRWYRSASGTRMLDRFKLRAPFIRDIVIQVYLVRFLRVMSLSLNGGVPLLDILTVCRGIIKNHLFDDFIASLETHVTEGKGVAAGFEAESFIPSLASQMIRTGEESGNLAMVMDKVADFYEEEIERKLKAFEKIVEPLMLVVMGLVVGIIVSSLILPIFKLSRAVH